jgi:hypothetical protein
MYWNLSVPFSVEIVNEVGCGDGGGGDDFGEVRILIAFGEGVPNMGGR